MIIRSPVSPLNKALYDRLRGALSSPTYDYVPDGKKPPYTVLADTEAQMWSSKTMPGADVLASIVIISTYQGDKEVAEIADVAISAVTSSPLIMADDWKITSTTVIKHTVNRLETYRQAIIQFGFKICDVRK
ncbi:MAG: DUF3168 domain-containing protein [Negativicutes bacterium]|nr:DUF3168 domain-containing protein [Negativicutes bacterium]